MKKLLILTVFFFLTINSYSQQASFKVKKSTCDSLDIFKGIMDKWFSSTNADTDLAFYTTWEDSAKSKVIVTLSMNNKVIGVCKWGGYADHTGDGCAFYLVIGNGSNKTEREFIFFDGQMRLIYNDKGKAYVFTRTPVFKKKKTIRRGDIIDQ
jgi:hypothetical protein